MLVSIKEKEESMDKIKKYQVSFTQVSNIVLADSSLSLKAKGIYAYLFSKPDDWQFHINFMQQELKETAGQIRSAINELIDRGYIIRKQFNENGKFGGMQYIFVPCENVKPNTTELNEKPYTEKTAYGQTLTHNNIDNNNNTDIEKENVLKEKDNVMNVFDSNVIEKWNEIAKRFGLPKISRMTDERRKRLERVLKENCLTINSFFDILTDKIRKSLFLQGLKQVKDGSDWRFECADWQSNFDFYLERGKMVKVIEDNYTDKIFLK